MPSPYAPGPTGVGRASQGYIDRQATAYGYYNRPVYQSQSSTTQNVVKVDEKETKLKKRRNGWIIFGIIAFIIVVIIIVIVLYLLLRPQPTPAPIVATIGESCVSLPCVSPLICEDQICKSGQNGPCPGGNGQCIQGKVCDNGQCKSGFNEPCTSNSDCATGLLCVVDKCI